MWIRYDHYLPTIFRHLLGVTGREAVGRLLLLQSPLLGFPFPLEGGNPKLRYLPWRADLVSSHMVRIGALAHCDAILGGSHVASVGMDCRFWFFLVGWFLWGGNHLDRWSKRFNYTYIIYIHMVDFLFSASDDLDGGLKKPEVFLQKSW